MPSAEEQKEQPKPDLFELDHEESLGGGMGQDGNLVLVPAAPKQACSDEMISAEWFNTLPAERKKQVLAEGLGARLLHEGLNYAVPLYWVSLDQQDVAELHNGTAFLIDCGHGTFAVTACHVYDSYRAAKRNSKDVVCQIGDLLFDPEARLIDCDPSLDIATFQVFPTELRLIDKPVLFSRDGDWPPHPANRGEFVFFAGYPGQSRGMSPGGHYFAAVPYRAMTPISAVTERQITCRFDRDYMLDLSGAGLPPAGYDIGGMSGGPLLIPTLLSNGISWRAGGVIVEAASGDLFEQIVAVRAHYILPDGRLQRIT
jgi:hypothetical protein